MTAQARVPAEKYFFVSSFQPGTLTRITKGYSRSTLYRTIGRSTLYRTIESAARMLGNNPSVWQDQLVLIVACVSFQVLPSVDPEWFALVVVDSKAGWMYASDLRPEGA